MMNWTCTENQKLSTTGSFRSESDKKKTYRKVEKEVKKLVKK